MKTLLLALFMLVGNLLIAQPVPHSNGGRYLKTVEYNVDMMGGEGPIYNLQRKSVIDKLFFGSTNSHVEFVYEAFPEGINEAVALRVIKDPEHDAYELEVMRLQNMMEVYGRLKHVLKEKTTTIFVPFWLSNMLSYEAEERIKEHNKQTAISKLSDELYQPYRPEPLKMTISKELAEKIHDKTIKLIVNFRGEGIPPMISDGDNVTFRCVVGDELWTLSIHVPQGQALLLCNLFRKIITESLDNRMDEATCLTSLDDF
ncbi:MAG TPA: hypothetical protein GXZ56_05965 [Bacteroidales bacterium]|jgi:hypothetical protein|nr:hypothetical protein [Bacteroidales bacterium]HHV03224.1 hypothetical protein [Bacteroidales bacterium]